MAQEVKSGALLVLGVLLATACDDRSDSPGNVMPESPSNGMRTTDSNIVAGPGEVSFSGKYDHSIRLPMFEKDFLTLLAAKNLEYGVYFDIAKSRGIPKPRWSENMDVGTTRKIYQIYGDWDQSKKAKEMYWAYVNDKDEVIYIENQFSYDPF